MKLKVIITGASGMVGEGVLQECLYNDQVEQVLVIGRRSCGYAHPKLKEIIHADMYDISTIIDQLKDYTACFFCLGMSSVGIKEPEYKKVTYELTMNFATALSNINSGMTFCYVSGRGTDGTEQGRSMWARVKGKTENALIKLPFNQVYNFRPGILKPASGSKNVLPAYKWMGWLIPIINFFSPNNIINIKDMGKAMINATIHGYDKKILEVKDILVLANK